MEKMHLPLVLRRLGYYVGPKTRWGPCSTSDNTYEELAENWPTGNAPLKSKEEFESTWTIIEAEIEADKYQTQRVEGVSGYAPIPDQLDMLYWDVYSGVFGEEAKSSTWFENCSGVKATYPK